MYLRYRLVFFNNISNGWGSSIRIVYVLSRQFFGCVELLLQFKSIQSTPDIKSTNYGDSEKKQQLDNELRVYVDSFVIHVFIFGYSRIFDKVTILNSNLKYIFALFSAFWLS